MDEKSREESVCVCVKNKDPEIERSEGSRIRVTLIITQTNEKT